MEKIKFKKYDKQEGYSFTFGIFPTFELVKNKPKEVICLLVHSKLKISEDITSLFDMCNRQNIEVITDDKTIERIAEKDNCLIVGVLRKYPIKTNNEGKHLVLVNPSDMGNMGTIMRTMLGYGITNLNIVKPCVDVFNPKVIRSSMGAIFSLNICEFENIEEYLKSNNNKKYFFMLDGKEILGKFIPEKNNFDLIFGNEGSGLPHFLIDEDTSVVIKHSNKIDSLNLPISVGIALYEFSKKDI